ncbi:MAG: RHS repeat-associated core domain-containing protein, partial [Terracidiphilus sp.]
GAAMTGGTNAVTMGLTWQHTNVWAGGKLLGTYDADGLHFYLDDPLGTRRAQTDAAGVLEQTCVSLPYGDGLSCENPSGSPYFPSTQYPTEHHFTGKERDAESGNDYFGARYYASSMGRFMSPDPLPWLKWQNSGGDSTGKDSERKKFNEWIEDPQHLNMYAYVRNNPLTRTDPTGMAECSYSISGHTLVCTSNKPSAKLSGNQHEVDTVGPEGVFSGLGEKQNQLRFEFDRNGPIPEGRYKMNEYFIDSHDRFRLEPWPNDRMSRIFRYAHHFRFDGLGAQLHHGHVSDGCINVSEDSPHAMQQFGKVLDLLKKEDGKNYLTVTK